MSGKMLLMFFPQTKGPQFSGQTKEKLSSKDFQTIAANITRDAFAIWLNKETELAERIANIANR